MASTPRPGPADRTHASRIIRCTTILLVVSVVINYIDRGNLSVAAPLLKVELGLSPEKMGVLLSAFFWSYATCQLLSGWLVDRYDVNWILAAGFFLWSCGTAVTGLIGGFGSLLLLRLLMGVAESVAYPAYSKIFATRFDENQRGVANSLIDAGSKCGPALGLLVGGFLVARYGWRPFFIVLGLGALPWLPFWIKWMPRGASAADSCLDAQPTVREILSLRSAWVSFAGLFCGNYFWYFLLTWLPSYFVQERHFSIRAMGVAGSLPFIATAASTTAAACLSYRAIARGATPTRVRRTCTSAGLAIAAVIVVVPLITDERASIAILLLASVGYGIFTSSIWAITQTIAGPVAAGRWTGLQNFIGNLAGVTAPIITGFVVQRTGHFFWAFVVTAAVALAGSMVSLFCLGEVEPTKWRPKPVPSSSR
jgi:ACS family D-galactonate transporter-like MFS transporter